MAHETQDVVAVIVSYNTKDLVERCIRSIEAAARETSVKVVVVDNGSSDGTPEYLRQRVHGVEIIALQENVGFAKAVNRAAGGRDCRYVLVANSDIEFTPNSIDAMVKAARDLPGCGILGPQLLDPAGGLQVSCAPLTSPFTPWLAILNPRRQIRRISAAARSGARPTGYVPGAAMLIAGDTFAQLGGFDESFFFYSEDEDLCLRARRAGWLTYFAPGIRVTHVRGASSTRVDQFKYEVQLVRAQLLYAMKHFSTLGLVTWKSGTWTLFTLLLIRDSVQHGVGLIQGSEAAVNETRGRMQGLVALRSALHLATRER